MIEPGIHFGLSDHAYHEDAANGSTDIRRLLKSAGDYWWFSPMNPMRPSTKPTPAQYFGRAVHKFVLEGREAFEATYAPTDFSGSTKDGKAELANIAVSGRLPLKRDDFNRIELSGQMIRMNPHLSEAFVGGHSEVSVFWERDGLRLKCRFDYLKVRAIADLKSIRNTRGMDFVAACRRSFSDYRYDIQAEHYLEGRAQIRRLLAEGRVFGRHDSEWLKKVAASNEFAFVFIFWQAEDAPITWAFSLSPGNTILDIGRHDIDRALSRHQEFMAKFGPDQPWVLADPVSEIDISELPAWFGRAA